MTCEECEERVFELIERETTDPDGVRKILSQCPECRILFDAMKAGLAEAQNLPREEPSSETDAAILRMAEARAAELGSRRRRFTGPQWAVAAAALLALTIGVWSIPRTAKPPSSPTALPPREETASVAAEPTEALDPSGATAALGSLERAEAPALRPRREGAPEVSNVPTEKKEQTSRIAMSDDGAGASANVRFEAAGDVATLQRRDAPLSPACRELRQRVAQRMQQSDASTGAVKPEQALSLGRCYRAAGDVSEARRWLEIAASDPETKRRALKELRTLPRP